MKKWTITAGLIATILFFGANFALADTSIRVSSTGTNAATDPAYQLTSGTITGWEVDGNINCDVGCAGAGASEITLALTINGTVVSTSTGGTGFSPATSTVTGLDIPFAAGANLQIVSTWDYVNNGVYGTITGTNLSDSPTPPATSTIAFVTPTNAAVLPANFYNWEVSLGNVTTTQLYRVDVEYQQFGGGTTYDDFNLITPTYSDALIGNTHAYIASGSSSTSYTATAYLTSNTSTDYFVAETDPGDVLASTTIEFTIGVTSSTPSSTPPLVSVCPSAPPIFQFTGSLPYFQINNPIPSIISGGCNILISGFVMSADQKADIDSRYATAASIISVKPPLGYFTVVGTALGSFSSGSSSINLFPDATTTAAFAPIFAPLDEGLAAAIGLLGLFWLHRRQKFIQP